MLFRNTGIAVSSAEAQLSRVFLVSLTFLGFRNLRDFHGFPIFTLEGADSYANFGLDEFLWLRARELRMLRSIRELGSLVFLGFPRFL